MRNKEYSWYMLANAPGFGTKSINYIYRNAQVNNLTINDLFDLNHNDLQYFFPEIGRGKLSKANFSCIHALETNEQLYGNFEKLKSEGIVLVGLDNDIYPKSVLVNMQDNAPPILYCKGYLPLLNQISISIVGARDVGEFEMTVTKKIAQKLADLGINVTSGYAKGIDTSAHVGALEAEGTTTMILSFGTNYISVKREIKDLNWEKNSLFVTQFAPYEKFSGQNAMTRNKLVCAMSKAIIVIKSGIEKDINGKMSGTFNAGKLGLNMGIPVFVLNPKKLDSISQGNIDLIKIGGIEFSNEIDIVNFFKGHEVEKLTKITMQQSTSYQTRLFD